MPRTSGLRILAHTPAVLLVSTAAAQFNPPISTTYPIAIFDTAMMDVNADGIPDLVFSLESISPSLAWAPGVGDGSFGSHQVIENRPERNATFLKLTDLDLDGDLDIVASGSDEVTSSNADAWIGAYENQGGGNFTPGGTFATSTRSIVPISSANINGAQTDEVFWFSEELVRVVVRFDPRPNGQTTGTTEVQSDYSPQTISVADLDGDGDGDLLVGETNSTPIQWSGFLGTGSSFGPPQSFPGHGSLTAHPSAADFNGDGVVDVATYDLGSTGININDGLGGGIFSTMRVVGRASDATSFPDVGALYAEDLDGDGDSDIIFPLTGTFGWLENDGTGQFATASLIAPSLGLAAVSNGFEDIDGDGDLDLYAVSRAGNGTSRIRYIENLAIGPIGSTYCSPAEINSTGLPGVLSAEGNTSVARNLVSLNATQLPAGSFTLFAASVSQGFTTNVGGGQGTLCLDNPLIRIRGAASLTNSLGDISLELDLTTDLGSPVIPGSTWNFQAWHRDFGSTSNLTDAVSIQFVP